MGSIAEVFVTVLRRRWRAQWWLGATCGFSNRLPTGHDHHGGSGP